MMLSSVIVPSDAPITAAKEEIGASDVLVCGKCNSVFNLFEDFNEHKRNLQQCTSLQKNKLNFQEQVCQVWGYLIWKNSQSDKVNPSVDVNDTNDPKISWNMYQKWCAMTDQERDAWVLAGKNLKTCKSISNADKIQDLEHILKSNDEIVGSISTDGFRKPANDVSNNTKESGLRNSSETTFGHPDPKIHEKLMELLKSCGRSTGSPFVLEKVLAKRYNHETRQFEYLLKWKDFADDQNTWEPADKLKHFSDHIQNYENQLQKLQSPKIKGRAPLSSVICSSTSGTDKESVNIETKSSSLNIMPYKPGEVVELPKSAVACMKQHDLNGEENCESCIKNAQDSAAASSGGQFTKYSAVYDVNNQTGKPVFRKTLVFKNKDIDGQKSIVQMLVQNSVKVDGVQIQYEPNNSDTAFTAVKKVDVNITGPVSENQTSELGSKFLTKTPLNKRAYGPTRSLYIASNYASNFTRDIDGTMIKSDGPNVSQINNIANYLTGIRAEETGTTNRLSEPILADSKTAEVSFSSGTDKPEYLSKYSSADIDEISDCTTSLMLLSQATDIAAKRGSKAPFTKKFPSRSGTDETYSSQISATTYQPILPKSTSSVGENPSSVNSTFVTLPKLKDPNFTLGMATITPTTTTSGVNRGSSSCIPPPKKRIKSSYGYTSSQPVTPTSRPLFSSLQSQWKPANLLSNNSEKSVSPPGMPQGTSEKCVGVSEDMFPPHPWAQAAYPSKQLTILGAILEGSSATTSSLSKETVNNPIRGRIMLRDTSKLKFPNLYPGVDDKKYRIVNPKMGHKVNKPALKYRKPLIRYTFVPTGSYGTIFSFNREKTAKSTPLPEPILTEIVHKLKDSRLKVVYVKNTNKNVQHLQTKSKPSRQTQKYYPQVIETGTVYPKLSAWQLSSLPTVYSLTREPLRPGPVLTPKQRLEAEIESKIKNTLAKNVPILPKTEANWRSQLDIFPSPIYNKGAQSRYVLKNTSVAMQPLEYNVPDCYKVDDLPEDLNCHPLSPQPTCYSLDPKTGVRPCKTEGEETPQPTPESTPGNSPRRTPLPNKSEKDSSAVISAVSLILQAAEQDITCDGSGENKSGVQNVIEQPATDERVILDDTVETIVQTSPLIDGVIASNVDMQIVSELADGSRVVRRARNNDATVTFSVDDSDGNILVNLVLDQTAILPDGSQITLRRDDEGDVLQIIPPGAGNNVEGTGEEGKEAGETEGQLQIDENFSGEESVVATIIEASEPDENGLRKVVLMLPNGNTMETHVTEEQFASFELNI